MLSSLLAFPSAPPLSRRAFTLVEMLVVMAVIIVLIGICKPVVSALSSAGDVSKTVYDLAGILSQSRAYAMGNNTYVYVGLEEVDVNTGQQTAGAVGQLAVVVVSTKDGTQGFSNGSTSNWSAAYPAFLSDLVVIGKPLVFNNVHVPDLGTPPASGGMARPKLSANANGSMSYSVGNANCVSATPFSYPLGASSNAVQYSFTKVIQFDPQGVARIQSASTPSAITTYLEIGLQQSHGTVVPTLPTSPTAGNIAAVQVDGMTGAVRIYRP